MDDGQQSEVVVIGFVDGEPALADELAGLDIAGENFDFGVAAVLHAARPSRWGDLGRHRASPTNKPRQAKTV